MSKKPKILTLDTKMPIGKYRGWKVSDVLLDDWTYIRWYVEKVWEGQVADEVSEVYMTPKEIRQL